MEKKTSDFLEYAKEKGKIKDVSEAFKEYPVEEEWHKGKIESLSYLQEEKENYNIYQIWRWNRRQKSFFVIIEQNNIAVPIENFGMLISSKIENAKYKTNKILEKDDKNNLRMDSIVKTDIVYRILNNQILFKIGTIDIDKVDEYKKNFYNCNK